jgi:hypothetical protein
MTWTKTGDEFSDECWTLSDAAYRLHHEGLTWSNRMLTDGQLAKDDMRRWAHHPDAAAELVDVGWWEDGGQHYQIVHHIGYQRTRKQIAKQSVANAKNANRRWSGKLKDSSNDSSNDSQCDSHNEAVDEPPDGTADGPTSHPGETCKSHNEAQCEMDRTGQDRHVLEGVPRKNGSESFAPTAEQLRRIDKNVARGYES